MTDFAPLTLETPAEHPFAQFVRILGKGKRGARNLTREEAREAMGMLLDEQVEDTQLGAFLMLLRHKEESPEELAGFTEAVRARLNAPSLNVDVDWPTYAGKKRHLPWYLDRKSTRLNSSHITISYAVFCLKKKKKSKTRQQLAKTKKKEKKKEYDITTN